MKFDINLDTLNLCDFVVEAGYIQKIDRENLPNCEDPKINQLIIDYIKLSGELFPNKNCDILIVLQSKLAQTNNFKYKFLKELQAEYESYKDTPNDYHCRKCKTVIINGQSDFPYKIRERLNELKINDIEYIKEYDKAMNSVIYGEQGKLNGIIEIRTKQDRN